MRRRQNVEIFRFFSENKLHKALRSVQFLSSFISFYFKIHISCLACGEKIIRPASKLDEQSTSDF